MAPSIRHRLTHPRKAIEQGLPTSDAEYHFREGEHTREITHEMHSRMRDYLLAVPLHDSSPVTKSQQEHLYANLSIIDSKAQALLSFNSFLLAIVGIYFGTVQSIRDEVFLLVPFVATLIASGISCLLCLDVVWVHWLTAKDMRPVADAKEDSVGEGFIELLLLRDERTRTYRLAWLLSFASVAAVVLGVLFAIFSDLVA